ncbi:MAG: GGDEF domain-containing response regulator [Phycisphaeraceae bacterium]
MQEPTLATAGELRMDGQQLRIPRVLVVRSDALRERVAASLEAAGVLAEVGLSPSYLAAMGWLSQHSSDVVIGPVSAMTGMVGSTARALRRLSPGARLIAVADEDEAGEGGAAVSAGFDQCVVEPADATSLVSAMRLEAPRREPDASATPADTALDARVSASDNAGKVESAQLSASPTSALNQDWLRFGFEEPTPIDLADGVGDVDLAEAVMRADGSLRPLAMRLLRQQSGLADAAYTPLGEVESSVESSVEVAYEERVFGTLSSPSGDTKSLSAWAKWLSRWVALEQKQADLYELAMHDELTGLWNRRYFERFLSRVIDHAAEGRQQVTLLVFDIDNFKQYNDAYGHPAGDEILQSTARLIQTLVREHDVVARIGGDEFAVIFWDKGEPRHLGSQHPDNVIGIAKRFQKAICEHKFPKLGKQAVGSLTVSGGLAGFPWDGRTPEELLARADAMAMRSKKQGKNAICFGPGAAPNGAH